MGKIIYLDTHKNKKDKIVAKKVGDVSISMYEDIDTGLPLFYVQSENENVLSVSYAIEDTLYKFKD